MKKRPFRLTFIDRVKIGLSDVPEIGVAFQPRVVHKDVDFAELCCSVHDKFLSVADAANVLLKSGDLAPGLLNTCPQPRRLPRCSSDNRKEMSAPSCANRSAMARPIALTTSSDCYGFSA